MRAEQEERQRSSRVVKLKLWGDALRNTITRMPNGPIDVITWFVCLERLFDQLQVPSDLRAVLMRPYLSDGAKALLARCDVARTADYGAIKRYLLQEMRLSSSVYLDKFNSVTRDNAETFYQFSLRLFEFYVESCKINRNYTKLVELVVYDRIKSVLPQILAKHVLDLEFAHKDGWLGRQALVEALDAYMASSTPDGGAKVAAIGNPKHEPQFKQSPQNTEVKKVVNPTVPSLSVTPVPAPRVRICFTCDSPDHIQAACPHKPPSERPPYFNRRSNFAKNKPTPQPRVNACLHENIQTTVVQAEAVHDDSDGSRNSRGDQLSADQSANQRVDVIDGKAVQNSTEPQNSNVKKVELTSTDGDVETLSYEKVSNSRVKPDNLTVDPLLASGWSHLHYVNVEIEGLPVEVSALNDSGAQLCCVRADAITPLSLPKLGFTKLRGITDKTVTEDLVSLRIKMSGRQSSIPVTCAVCDKLNGLLILGSDVVDRLHTQMLKEHYASRKVSNALVADCETDDAVDVRVIADDDVIDDEIVDDFDIGQNTDAVMNADANNSQTNDTHTQALLMH